MDHKKQKKKRMKMIIVLIAIIIIALILEASILYNVNNKNIEKTSEVLMNQVVDIMKENQKNEDEMMQSLKEDYMVRAKAVAYIIDAKPEAENSTKELQKIADLMSIDEIHVFNKEGQIYRGTVPKYYGYNFNSGKQMAYFKPMLKNKKLTMCQDVTPNTSEGKKMMYAITWDESGTKMIQVGIEPVRLLEEVKQNEVETVVNNMPVYKGISIYVADQRSGKIYGATRQSDIGKTLNSIGIQKKNVKNNKIFTGITDINGQKSKYILKKIDDYVISIVYKISSDNMSNMTALLIVAVYLSIAGGCLLFVISRLSKVKREKKEQSEILTSISEISNTDNLTGCYNRRAYEKDIHTLPKEKQFIYISMDVNGLKIVNDSMGHTAGDELLCGAAACMKQCFDPYGKVYRIGGDEFIAILPVEREQFAWIKMEFERVVREWTGNQIEAISISSGFVSSGERQWASVKEIANTADIRMYEEKAMYYKKNGVDRRGQPEAYVALYKLYSVILTINLQQDHYKILSKENDGRKWIDTGKISEWLQDLEQLENIYKDDLEEYKEKVNLEYFRIYFAENKKSLSISYRKKDGEEYKRISLEIVLREENSGDIPEYFLYLKNQQ